MLVVLQTHVPFERDRDGKIHIKIEKKPTRDSLLKALGASHEYTPHPARRIG